MKREIIRTSLAALLYFGVDVLAKALLVMPDNPLVNMANFLPPLLGLMWGPSAAVGSMIGALGAEYADLLPLPQILQEKGTAAFLWESLRSFCNCGLWAFVAAWLPWRLWHSILVRPDEPLFALRPRIILKYVFILFVTTLTTSLLCAMSADEAYMLHYIGRADEFLCRTGG